MLIRLFSQFCDHSRFPIALTLKTVLRTVLKLANMSSSSQAILIYRIRFVCVYDLGTLSFIADCFTRCLDHCFLCFRLLFDYITLELNYWYLKLFICWFFLASVSGPQVPKGELFTFSTVRGIFSRNSYTLAILRLNFTLFHVWMLLVYDLSSFL